MRIAVVGAGVAGVAAAHALSTQGHRVTVYECRNVVCGESSFGLAGLAAPSLLVPGAFSAIEQLHEAGWWRLGREAQVQPRFEGTSWRWLWRARRSLHPSLQPQWRLAARSLAMLGVQQLRKVASVHGMAYERSGGHLVLLRDAKAAARAEAMVEELGSQGVAAHWLSPAECLQREPGLSPHSRIVGGLHLPTEEQGNCRQFTQLLKDACERQGVVFQFSTQVSAITPGPNPRVTAIRLPGESELGASRSPHSTLPRASSSAERMEESHDAVVLCTGAQGAALLEPLGISLPLIPLHGYSVTATVRDPDRAPVSAVTFAAEGLTISRLGQRVRVSGGIELGTAADKQNDARVRSLYRALEERFPGAGDSRQTQVWKGSSPTLADGLPAIGDSGVPGVWLSLGLGAHGWAWSLGGAQLLADLIGGRQPALSHAPYEPRRLALR